MFGGRKNLALELIVDSFLLNILSVSLEKKNITLLFIKIIKRYHVGKCKLK